jgi:hypothetical protein
MLVISSGGWNATLFATFQSVLEDDEEEMVNYRDALVLNFRIIFAYCTHIFIIFFM